MDIPKLFRDVKVEIAGGTELDTAVQNAIARYRVNPLLMSENSHLEGKVCDECGNVFQYIGVRGGKEYYQCGHRICTTPVQRNQLTPDEARAAQFLENPLLMTVMGANPGKKKRKRSAKSRKRRNSGVRRLKNPGRTKRKITMTIRQFYDHLKKQGDPKLLREFKKKIEGYRKWTHGSMPKKVTLELKNVPGMSGIWLTYGMGVQPESTYLMPKGSRRKGAWKHEWEKHPELKGDPESGLILTQLVKGNKLTDFLHG